MKNLSKLFAVIGILCIAQLSIGQGITGTKHDFKGAGWNTSGEICIVCHTPHDATTSVTDAPLWNHALTGETFSLYTSSTLDASLGQPDGNSKLCLSCHDGVTGLDAFGGASGVPTLIGAAGLVGTDLSGEHPISFTYDAALVTADGGLKAITSTTPLGGTIDDDLLFDGKMQCGSCHDVHDDTQGNFLIMANTASALCLTCHDK